VWKGESIIVLDHIQVDPPYGAENCRILSSPNGKQQGALADSSLGRVKKIVAANSNTTAG
jgi:protein LSM12